MGFSAKQIAEGVAAGLGLIAIAAGVADWRHRRRSDLDKVSLLDWRSVQVYALIGAGLTIWAIVAM